MPRPVNYDLIAHVYDDARRDYELDKNLVAYLREHSDIPPNDVRVLDVGCGTGKQLTANRASLPQAQLVGLDRYAGMLNVARPRCPEISWVHGDGSSLPFASRQFDYACNQFSYHHVPDKGRLLSEIFRVLKPGGRFALWNIDPWSMERWIIYQFFPEARMLDEEDFLQASVLADLIEKAGFWNIQTSRTPIQLTENLQDFHAYALQRHQASQFMALPDDQYHAGVVRIEHALTAGDARVIESELCLVTITGDKPGGSI